MIMRFHIKIWTSSFSCKIKACVFAWKSLADIPVQGAQGATVPLEPPSLRMPVAALGTFESENLELRPKMFLIKPLYGARSQDDGYTCEVG